ncbi:MAG TPA: YgiQ family radical SAM protein [Bacteroidales bacterium]|nr:YgiQ family radical SAM protein [Bacteroidales bacterium]
MQKQTALPFFPTSAKEVEQLGWTSIDVILFTGDAYVDHPSFGVAVIGRVLEKQGLKVAIVPQPNWQDDLRDFRKLGKPNLFFGITAGNMDSMINHYTAAKRLRSNDDYTAGGKAGRRPDYAVKVYTCIVKKLFPDVPVILGGIEASLRRFTHYDYWSDSLMPSVLAETKADLLFYGMAEKALEEFVKLLQAGKPFSEARKIPQLAYLVKDKADIEVEDGAKTIYLHSFEKCQKDKLAFGENFKFIEEESNKIHAARIVEPVGNGFVVVNPPFAYLTQDENDAPYELPYSRLPHPRYKEAIPAFDMIKNSINIHRGCFGGCSFCTISAHQGKFIRSRSPESVMREVLNLSKMPYFNGTITDLGGPSANMYMMSGIDKAICEKCKRPSCIFPAICKNLDTNHKPQNDLLQAARDVAGIKHVFIGSGIRYDLLFNAPNVETKKSSDEYFANLVKYHVSGRLKVAPEHSSDEVLKLMRKPSFALFKRFKDEFDKLNARFGKRQYIIPYFISSHPGSTIDAMAALAENNRQLNINPEQVQDFTPTPMTLSSCIYYTGIDPYTGKKVYVARSKDDKKMQNAFFFWYKPEYRKILFEYLKRIKRTDILNKLYPRR